MTGLSHRTLFQPTVLLALARGSGGRSLSGMAHRRGLLRRPFLALPRRTTEEVCAALDLEPWHDPTNRPGDGPAPLRSRVRHEVLPVLREVLGPGVPEALARTADQLREDADLLDHLAAQVLREARGGATAVLDLDVDGHEILEHDAARLYHRRFKPLTRIGVP